MKMIFYQSSPSTSAFCHGWWDEHFPSSPLRGWVDLSYCVGFSLSIHTCGLLQKYTLLQVLNDDECFRSSWGWIKSNRQAKCTTVCTWTVHLHDAVLSKLYPGYLGLEGRCVLVSIVFWHSRRTAQLLKLCSYEWVSSGSAAHWEPLHCHRPPTILTHLHWECCHGSCWNWYCLLSARWSKREHWVSGFGTPGTYIQLLRIPLAALPQWWWLSKWWC